MFRNLLKYDMKYVWKIWRIMAVSLFGLSFVGSFVLRYILEHFDKMEHSFGLAAMFALFMICAYLSFFAATMISTVFIYIRFYKNFFTDEGYLTFTLPVKRGTLLWSKTVNSMLWTGLFMVLVLVCAIPFSIISPPAEKGELINFVVYEVLGDFFGEVWQGVGAWLFVYIAEAIVVFAAILFYSAAITQFCITVGAILVKKAKVLLGIGIYYLVSMVISFLWQLINITFTLCLIGGFDKLLDGASNNVYSAFFALMILIVGAMMATLGFVFQSVTQNCLEKRLNLA